MIIPSSNRVSVVSELNLYICGLKIAKDTSCKYFGIYIENRLKWDIHVDYVYRKIIKSTRILQVTWCSKDVLFEKIIL